jgi:hypothetical protein
MSFKSIYDQEVDLYDRLLIVINNQFIESQSWITNYPVVHELVQNNYLICCESKDLNQLRVNLETSMKTLDFDHEKKTDILKIFKLPYLEILKLNLQYLYIPQEIAIVFEKLEEFRRENINLTNNIMGAVGSC